MKTTQPASLLGQCVLIWSTNRPSQAPGGGQSWAEASAMAREPLSWVISLGHGQALLPIFPPIPSESRTEALLRSPKGSGSGICWGLSPQPSQALGSEVFFSQNLAG